VVNRVGKRGLLKGQWLIDPEGQKVGTFMDDHTARHCAAALNLTTAKQRTDKILQGTGLEIDGPR
jgi:hypothetical protein